jgi:AcrR family transcriptional regulator
MPPVDARSVPPPTRQRILDEAERLIAVKGVYGFTLRDIATPLSVQVPAIYKHYRSRDDVLIEVSRRYITVLATQFELRPKLAPVAALRAALNAFVDMMMENPAYARLALVDFATPGGGMDYVKLAAGGSFKENFVGGPLAAMHTRLRRLLQAGIRSGDFRRVDASDVYRLVKAQLLIRLVFPDDSLLSRRANIAEARAVKRWLWDITTRHLAPQRGDAASALLSPRSGADRKRPRAVAR